MMLWISLSLSPSLDLSRFFFYFLNSENIVEDVVDLEVIGLIVEDAVEVLETEVDCEKVEVEVSDKVVGLILCSPFYLIKYKFE